MGSNLLFVEHSIQQGSVIVTSKGRTLVTLGAEKFFGEMSFLKSTITSAAIQASKEGCTLQRMTRDVLLRALDNGTGV